MAFFDNLSKKATEATATAMQKAKELSETARLSSLISDEEKKINNTYCQIGKLYVSLYGEQADEAFAAMVADISEAEGKISSYKKQIKDIKGVQRCTNCGAEVAKGTSFCSVCGAPVQKEETAIADNRVKCESCGTLVEPGMRFCTSCGHLMTSDSKPVEPQMVVAEKVCPNCGAKVAENVAFCAGCGTKL